MHAGDRVAFVVHDDGTVTVHAETVDLGALRGLLKPARTPTVDQMRDAIRAGGTRR